MSFKTRIRPVLLCLVAVALAAWYWRYSRTAEPIDWRHNGSDTAMISSPTYLQADPRWGNHTIGGSGETMASVGCTICALSMALGQHGIYLPPDELNRQLKAKGGFTKRGWLIWAAVSEVTEGRAVVEIPFRADHSRIEAALAAGDGVLNRQKHIIQMARFESIHRHGQ